MHLRAAVLSAVLLTACIAASPARGQKSIPDSIAALSSTAPARDYVAEVRANFTPEARRYARTRQALAFVDPFYALLVAAIILFTGLSARMRNVATSVGTFRYVHTLLYFVLYVLVSWVLTFPLNVYTGYVMEHQYDLSNQNFGAWIGDEGKALMLAVLLLGVVPVVHVAYRTLKLKRWWLPLSLGALPLFVVSVLITPIVIEPVFNKFTPLHDAVLRDKIVALAEKAGIPGRNVYEVDKSRQTKKFNAYVNGFGATQRIVLWDTTLKGMSQEEILFVMGHEMGHYVLKHIWKGIAFYWLLLSAILFLLNRGLSGVIARFGPRWGFSEVGDLASVPLLIAGIGLVSFLAQPLSNSFGRGVEHEADVFGLEVTQLNGPAAGAFIKLGAENKSDPEPSPFIRAWLYDHPPLIERVTFALDYHPWTEGKPNRFFHGKE